MSDESQTGQEAVEDQVQATEAGETQADQPNPESTGADGAADFDDLGGYDDLRDAVMNGDVSLDADPDETITTDGRYIDPDERVTDPDAEQPVAEAGQEAADDEEERGQPELADEQSEQPESTEEQQEKTETPKAEETVEEPEIEAFKTRRLKAKNELDERTLQIAQANPDMTLPEAMEKAKLELGGSQADSTDGDGTESAQQPQIPDGVPSTTQEIDAKLAKLRDERKAASADLDLARLDEIHEQIDQLVDARPLVAEQATRADQSFNEQFRSSEQVVIEAYPDAAKHDSPFAKRMSEIDSEWERLGDPRFGAANKPQLIANLAAAELGVAPKSKSTTEPAKPSRANPATPVSSDKPSATSPSPVGKGLQPASGKSRTQNTETQFDALVDGMSSLDDYDKLIELMS